MATKKLSAIWRIIRSTNFTLINIGSDGVRILSHGKEDLATSMTVAITLQKVHEQLIEQINEQAAEGGQLHALQALRESVATLEKDAKNESTE
jgi:hypothetical protein